MMMTFCVKEFPECIMYSTSDLVISLVYPLYGKEYVMQRDIFLMVLMNISMMGMCRPCVHMFKLSGLIFSLKAFILN